MVLVGFHFPSPSSLQKLWLMDTDCDNVPPQSSIHIYNADTPGSLNTGIISGDDSAMLDPVLVAHVIVRVGGLPKEPSMH